MKKTKWTSCEGLGDLLAFASRHGSPIKQIDDTLGSYIPKLPNHIGKARASIVVFGDGAAMACVSAIEYTGFCSTCADEDAWTGYFVTDKWVQ